jgi:hypothetical protein
MAENIINKDLKTHADVFTDLYANAPSRMAYNVGVNADLANRVSQGLGSVPGIGPALSAVADVAMPAGAFALSPAYDTLQGISRAGTQYSDKGPYAGIVDDTEVPAGPTLGQIGQAIANEKIGQTMFGRMVGASAPLANRISNFSAPNIMGTAQAAEVNPGSVVDVGAVQAAIDRARAQDFIDARAETKNQSSGVIDPDRGRGMPGTMGAYEMIGGTPVAVGDVLGRQQALEKADFYEEPTQGINYDALGILGTLGGLLTGSTALRGLGMFGNYKSGKMGRAFDGISKGLGSLGSRFAGSMRGINPTTGRPNTQAQYEANRAARSTQSRIDNMLERKAKGLSYSQKNLDRLSAEVNKGINQREAAALADKTKSTSTGVRTDIDVADGGAEAGGGGKIVCTMMNERYGFGSFRNKIWMKFHEHHGPEYQKGYHAIFLPLVKIAKGEGKINTAVRKVLEHMGRHVTADMFKIMKGKKRDTLGRIYRAIFEPACHIIGKIKSALGRG